MANTKKCTFCGKEYTEEDVSEKGISLLRSKINTDVLICSKCLTRGHKKLEDRRRQLLEEEEEKAKANINTPRDIKAYLDEWVIEQEHPKKTVATEIYAHKKRIKRLENNPEDAKKLRMDKSNIIFLGPTGSGKTETVRAICSCLDLPYTVQDVSAYTASGYVGLCQ